MTEIDSKIIKRTQDTLGPLIKRPALTDKLLSRPPFRFIHDICTSLIRTTGLMKGLFTSDELVADNVKEKQAKMAFLQKLIDFASTGLNRKVAAKPASIVAGKEADKTNALLVMLAQMVNNKKVSSADVVKRVLKQQQQSSTDASKQSSEPVKSSTKPKPADDTKEIKKLEAPPITERQQKESPVTKTDECTKVEKNEMIAPPFEQVPSSNHSTSVDTVDPVTELQSVPAETTPSSSTTTTPEETLQKADPSIALIQRNESDGQPIHSPPLVEVSEVCQQEEEVLSGNPTPKPSPRRSTATTKAADNGPQSTSIGSPILEVESLDSLNLNSTQRKVSASHQPVQPPIEPFRQFNDNIDVKFSGRIIMENEEDQTENESMLVQQPESIQDDLLRSSNELGDGEHQEHGGLVKRMLASKKSFEDTNMSLSQQSNQLVECIDQLAERRQRDSLLNELAHLGRSLQSLSRFFLPTGKLFDFVQEDLDAMQLEFDQWSREGEKLEEELNREESITQKELEPLRSKLTQLTYEANEKRDLLHSLKSKVIQNDVRINELISTCLSRAEQ